MIRLSLSLLLVLLAAYALWEAHPLLAGPAVALTTPANGASYADGVVTVAGRARYAASLTLDGAPLYEDEAGRFSEVLAFPTGGAILTVRATDRFGRSITKTRTIYVP